MTRTDASAELPRACRVVEEAGQGQALAEFHGVAGVFLVLQEGIEDGYYAGVVQVAQEFCLVDEEADQLLIFDVLFLELLQGYHPV